MESKKINQLATELAPDLSDLTIIGDPTTGISKKITLSQMASLFTGTVEEYANLAAFPLVGVADTIYIALDTNVIYRYDTSLSAYVILSPNIINSLVFSDANGFDGTITLVGSVATLSITTALTLGSVPFIGASGALTQDNSNLFFDDTNNRLGINTNAPTTALDVFGSGIIGRLNATSTNNAYLGFASNGTNKWSAGNVQSDHRFRIFSEANSAELITILQTGEFGIGIANPLTKLHIDGGATALIANLDANVSVAKSISFRSDNSSRINLEVSGTESGSNAGADLFLRTFTDAGALLETPFQITRSTGLATFKNIAITGLTSGYLPKANGSSALSNSLIWDNGTNVGIGNTNTSYTLDVSGTLRNTTSAYFATTSGNVGIGTTSPNIGGYGANSRLLTIQGVSGSYGILELTSNSANADGSAIGRLDFGSDGQAANYKAISSIASFLSGSTSTKFGADLRFYTRADNAASGDPVERMRISRDGFVGINSINPSSRLYVQTTSGATKAYDDTTKTNILVFDDTSMVAGVGGSITFGGYKTSNTNGGNFAAIDGVKENGTSGNEAGIFRIWTANGSGIFAERIRVTGTNGGQLAVGGSTNTFIDYSGNVARFYGGGSTNTFGLGAGSTIYYQGDASQLYPTADNTRQLGTSGFRYTNVYATSGVVSTSDEREKKDIINSDLGLDFVNKLRPVSYKWKVGQNIETTEITIDEEGNEITKSIITPRAGIRTHYGLIAQEVESLLNGKDFGGFIHDKETDIKGLRYEQFIPLLIKAIQELKAEIDILKDK